MLYAALAFEVVIVAGVVALVWVLGKGSEHRARTSAQGVALAVAAFALTGTFAFASIHYRWPAGWTAAVAVSAIVLVGVALLAGMDVGWKPIKVLVLAGLFGLGSLGFGTLMTGGIGAGRLQGFYEVRARQIAGANGFVALLPRGRKLPTDQLPVTAQPDGSLVLLYSGFELTEHKEAATLTEGDLLGIVGPGAVFVRDVKVPADARVTTLAVNGAPAVGAEFTYTPEAAPLGRSASPQLTTVFVTHLDGVEVRIWSGGREELVDGKWKQYPAYSLAELAEIAETLEPLE